MVLDNLNTHTPSSLYEAFHPTEARRILRKIAFQFTPKHGSWLNMVEIEIGVLSQQCLVPSSRRWWRRSQVGPQKKCGHEE